jgi:predicted Zn-dependent protease
MYQVPNHEPNYYPTNPISINRRSYLFVRATYIKRIDALVKITSPLNDSQLPRNLFDKNRRQWKSDNILLWLQDRYKPDRDNKLLAICDFDAYSSGLNFVFGQAQIDGGLSVIYLPRLRQEFYP